MRLICPNCGAQYEVDDRVIPPSGRDVQCSNCGHAWFQRGPHEEDEAGASEANEHAAAQAAPETTSDAGQDAGQNGEREGGEAATPEGEAPEGDGEAAQEHPEQDHAGQKQPEEEEREGSEAAAAHEAGEADQGVSEDQSGAQEAPEHDTREQEAADLEASERNAEPDAEHDGAQGEAEEPPAEEEPAATPLRQELDDSVLSILREEAERELEERAREQGSLETQEELGLGEPVRETIVEAEIHERMVRLRGLDIEEPEPETGSRRDLLPDIEAINSSLSPVGVGAVEDEFDDFAAPPPGRSGGVARGFLLVMVLAVVLVLLYAYSGPLAARFPALAPALDSFTGVVDGLRAWLDQVLRGATARLSRSG